MAFYIRASMYMKILQTIECAGEQVSCGVKPPNTPSLLWMFQTPGEMTCEETLSNRRASSCLIPHFASRSALKLRMLPK